MIILNITDLLICCFSLANLVFFIEFVKSMQWLLKIGNANGTKRPRNAFQNQDSSIIYWHIALVPPSLHLALFSCFITLILSLTRTIALVKPLWLVRKKLVYWSVGICSIVLFLLCGVHGTVLYFKQQARADNNPYVQKFSNETKRLITGAADALDKLQLILIGLMVIPVGILTVFSLKALRKSKSIKIGQKIQNENSKKASIVILTLSIIFLVCNGAWCLMWLPSLTLNISQKSKQILKMITVFLNIFMMSLNSSANPVVYLVRNSGLNRYVKRHMLRLRSYL